jgi:(S)-sulfolactate dehydrogenase
MAELVISETMEPDAVARLGRDLAVRYDPALVDDRPALLAELADARGLIVRNRTQVDAALLDAAPHLRTVGRLGVGLDNIDVQACRARGIAVRPASGANARSVAEYVITALLVLRRGCFRASDQVAAGAWPRGALQGDEAAGATLGLIGFGGIARAVAQRARALGLEVVASDPQVPDDDPCWSEHGVAPVALDDLLRRADAVSLHVPLTEGTRHLIDAAALARMKPEAVLINTARGGVVDDAALAEALRADRLRGAALDVFEQEPLPADSPFAGLDNVLLTPHVAGLTRQSNRRVSDMVADAVLADLQGTAA